MDNINDIVDIIDRDYLIAEKEYQEFLKKKIELDTPIENTSDSKNV